MELEKRIRTKDILVHILFWVIYIVIWSAKDLAFHFQYLDLLSNNLFMMLPYVPFVYFNLYFLMPRFLMERKYYLYSIIFLPLIIGMAWVSGECSVLYFTKFVTDAETTAAFFGSLEGRSVLLSEILILTGISMSLFLLNEWYGKERLSSRLQKEKLKAELSLLKSQINPHFLFNALNSIHVTMESDSEKSRNMIVQLSDLLSHQIYESTKSFIPLDDELKNLRTYIEIESYRHGNLADIKIRLPQKTNGQIISPMLLQPLVENAFKYSKDVKPYWVNLNMQLNNETLSLDIENSFTSNVSPDKSQGIGLSNLKRQLELIYPGKHSISIKNNDAVFSVGLKINLDED